MASQMLSSRRDFIKVGAGITLVPGLLGWLPHLVAAEKTQGAIEPPQKVHRMAFLKVNGHSWWFGGYFAWFDEKAYGTNAGKKRLARFKNRFGGKLPFPNARMVKVWDPDPSKARNYASVFRDVEPVRTLDEALRDVDAVLIPDASGFGEDHLELVRPCLERRLPTFVDKPMARRLGDCIEMQRLSQKHNTPLMSFSTLRYSPLVYEAKKVYPDMKDVVHIKGGGIGHLFLYGIHPVELLCAFRGPGVVSVANVGTRDIEVIRLRYKDGPMVTATVFVRKAPSGYSSTHLTVFGRRGNLSLFLDKYIEMSHEGAFRGLGQFVQTIRTRKTPYPLSDTIEIIRILLAAQRSRREGGREVPLAEIAPDDQWIEEK